MTHEIMSELGRRNRSLHNRDQSHYQTVKLVVQRQGRDSAAVSLVVTDVGNHRLTDTRLGFAIISLTDEVGRELAPHYLLLRAWNALMSPAQDEGPG